MLILSRSDVERLLDPDALREAIARAMADKLVSLFPRNTDRPTHQAVIVAFDPDNGSPAALMDGEAITAARTAAGSALATDLLARKEAAVLAVIGTGVQARAHLRALARVRAFREVRIAGRDAAKAAALGKEARAWLGGATIRTMTSYAQAIAGADVVAATTHSPDPVVRREWLAPGSHVNSVGYNTAGREIDGATIRDALLVVESRAGTLAPPPTGSNDIALAIAEGLVTATHVHAELGELVSGTRPGRTDAAQITLYKSVGVAVQDAAASSTESHSSPTFAWKRKGAGRPVSSAVTTSPDTPSTTHAALGASPSVSRACPF
ncbi:MAG: ornithine cyclodeaminase family protein [Chloroflexi bacterium]|nr:MAG: ornithine cyclodeaminase family protein [Chloroflexota bacterium]